MLRLVVWAHAYTEPDIRSLPRPGRLTGAAAGGIGASWKNVVPESRSYEALLLLCHLDFGELLCSRQRDLEQRSTLRILHTIPDKINKTRPRDS